MFKTPKQLTLRTCEFCKAKFESARSTAKFCRPSHRVASFNAAARKATRQKRSEQRSAISLGFDGRVGGKRRAFVGRTLNKVHGLRGWRTPITFDAAVANG